jgi:hypothetical protein
MTGGRDPRLARLVRLAELVHQADLARLALARAAVEATRQRLSTLAPSPVESEDISLQRAQLLHEVWAATRKRRLEAELRIQVAHQEQIRDTAARSFARSRVLQSINRRPDQPS